MAGAYADVPGRRFAYDADGSVFLETPSVGGYGSLPGVGTLPATYFINSQAYALDYNDEGTDSAGGKLTYQRAKWEAILFPEKREIDGLYGASPGIGSWTTYSTDSNNGMNGAWTTFPYYWRTSVALDDYRTYITSFALSNVTAIMSCGQTGAYTDQYRRTLHIYGTITPGETPDRILFLDTENSDAVFTKLLDYGDLPRGQTQVRTFKVKNNSSTMTANTIQVTAEDIYGGSGAWYTFSDDNVSFQATFPVGNLGPGATKLLYLKQIVPDAQTPSVHAARIKVNQASWS